MYVSLYRSKCNTFAVLRSELLTANDDTYELVPVAVGPPGLVAVLYAAHWVTVGFGVTITVPSDNVASFVGSHVPKQNANSLKNVGNAPWLGKSPGSDS